VLVWEAGEVPGEWKAEVRKPQYRAASDQGTLAESDSGVAEVLHVGGSKRGSSSGDRKQDVPRPLSVGEETLAIHLAAYGIPFEREIRLIHDRQLRWDFYLRQKDLAIEVSGSTWKKGAHSSGTGILRDYRKNNLAVLAGLKVLYFTTDQVTSGEAIDVVLTALGMERYVVR
jgi:hypothetical protein